MALIPPIPSPISPIEEDQSLAISLPVAGTGFYFANIQLYGGVNDDLVYEYLTMLEELNVAVEGYDVYRNHDLDGFVLLGNALITNEERPDDQYWFCIQDLGEGMTCAETQGVKSYFEWN